MNSAVESFMARWKEVHVTEHSIDKLETFVDRCRFDLREAGFTEEEIIERLGLRLTPLIADALRFENR